MGDREPDGGFREVLHQVERTDAQTKSLHNLTTMKVFYFIIIALMILLALLFAEWNGIWIAEGVLAGIGFAVADEIHKRGRKKE